MPYAVVLVAALMQPMGIRAEFLALFTRLEYRYTGGDYRDELFRYRLFVPGPSEEPRPLIVWLHGFGEAGSDNIRHLLWLDQTVFSAPYKRDRYPFFLLAVHCPLENPNWTRGGTKGGDDMVHVVKAILDQTLRDYPIDRERVYLAGISSGGEGCWELAIKHPEYFAAVAPISSAGADVTRVTQLREVPTWVFNCRTDSTTPIEGVRATVRALKAAGGSVHLTEVDSSLHDAWTAAFEEYHLLDWLLAQRRGQPSRPPGNVPLGTRLADFAKGWQWWQVLAQVGIPVLLFAVAWQTLRARRHAMARSSGRPRRAPAG